MGQLRNVGALPDDDEEEGLDTKLSMSILLSAFVRARRLIALVAAGALALTVFYATVLHKSEYTAIAVIGPVEADTGTSGVRQALSAYTGVLTGGIGAGNFTKFTEVLTSARLADALQRNYDIASVVFPGMWDSDKREWRRPSGPVAQAKEAVKRALGLRPWSPPTSARFAQYLKKRLKVTRVAGNTPFDLRNQTTAVSISMDDPDKAVRFLRLVLYTADDLCRQDQLANSQRRVDYLTKQLKQTNEIVLQQSLQQLLISEEQTLLTLHANRFYAVDLIDTPNADTIPNGTRVAVLLFEGLAGGIILGLAIVFMLMRKRIRSGMSEDEALEQPFPDPVGAILRRWRGR